MAGETPPTTLRDPAEFGPSGNGSFGPQTTTTTSPSTPQSGPRSTDGTGAGPGIRSATNPTNYFRTVEEAEEWLLLNGNALSIDTDQFWYMSREDPARFLLAMNQMYQTIPPARSPWVGEGVAGSSVDELAGFDDSKLQYTYQDFGRVIKHFTPGQITTFMEEAKLAELIPETYVGTGGMDLYITYAMQEIMHAANQSGDPWQLALTKLGVAKEEERRLAAAEGFRMARANSSYARGNFVASAPYVPLDNAYLNQKSKEAVRLALGRDPNQWEVDLMNQEQRSAHSASYSSDVANQRAVFDAKGRAIEFSLEREGTWDIPIAIGPGVAEVDEEARFAENFEKRYEVQLDEHERSGRMRQDSRNLFSGLRSLSREEGGK